MDPADAYEALYAPRARVDTYDRAAIQALLMAVASPLELEESTYDAAGRQLYQGPPGGSTAIVGVESVHTDFVIYDRDGARVAEIPVVHEFGDEYDPYEALDDARALALFFAVAPDCLARLLREQ